MQRTAISLARNLLLVAAFFIHSSHARAQTIDYGGLQDLFGEPVTTSATGKPQRASDAPVAMEIISADQIRRMGAVSLPEILNRVPGLTSWQSSRAWSDIGVRGQNAIYNPTLLVLVNGRQVYIDSYGYTDWSLIPVQLEEIRQIEIVKGPTTALYGFNAVSGVINIVTYNPKYDKVSEAGVTAGTGSFGKVQGIHTMKLSDNVSLRVSGNLQSMDEFDLRSKTAFASSGPFRDTDSLGHVNLDSIAQLTDKTQLRLESSYSSVKASEVPTVPSSVPSDKNFASGKASIISDTSIGTVEANLYTNIFHNEIGGSSPGKIESQITVAQLQDLFKVGTDHTFRVQTEYRHNSLESAAFAGPDAEVFYDVAALGGMWNWALTPAVEWTNALRLDYLMLGRDGPFATAAPFTSNDEFDQNILDYSLNSSIVWKATNKDTLRASYARGIEAPSLFSFGAGLDTGGVAYVGNPNLEPVVAYNYEVGYDRKLDSIGGKFRSSLFYKRTEGIESLGGTFYISGITPVLQGAVIGDSETVGMELGFNGTIGQEWDWDVGYIYQNSADDFTAAASGNPSAVATHFQDTVPHHVVKAHAGYTTGPWETDLYAEVGSSFDAASANGVSYDIFNLDGYYTVSGRVGYTFDDAITVALSGVNLSQARVANNYGLENERQVFLSVSKKF